jgi:hypothetical protein
MPNSTGSEEVLFPSLPEELLLRSLCDQALKLIPDAKEEGLLIPDLEQKPLALISDSNEDTDPSDPEEKRRPPAWISDSPENSDTGEKLHSICYTPDSILRSLENKRNQLDINRREEEKEHTFIQFLINQIQYNIEKIIRLKEENRKKEEQKEREKNSVFFKYFKKIDDGIDKTIAVSKVGSNALKLLKYFTILGSNLVKLITFPISGLGDVWAFFKAYLDKTKIARKTSIGAAVIRFTRSAAALILFGLAISNPIITITCLAIGALAGLYRDSYITYQNKQSIKQQKIIIANEKNKLLQYKAKGVDKNIIKRQEAVIQKEIEELDKLKNYRLKNKLKMTLNAMSSMGIIFIIAGLFFPPIMLPGLVFVTTASTLKAIDKISNDGISRFINWVRSFKKAPLQNTAHDTSLNTKQRSTAPTSINHTHKQTDRNQKKSFLNLALSSELYPSLNKKPQHQILKPLLIPNTTFSPVSPVSSKSLSLSESSLENQISPASPPLVDSPISPFPPVSPLATNQVLFFSDKNQSSPSANHIKSCVSNKKADNFAVNSTKTNETFHFLQKEINDNECFSSKRKHSFRSSPS